MTDEPDPVVEELITASRALVGIAVRSVAASPVDVTLVQHRVLVLLSTRGPQTVGAVADELGVNASNASRVCDRLQRVGLATRERAAHDARSVQVSITPAGTEVLRAIHAERRREVGAILRTLPADVTRDAVDALRAFNDAAHEPGLHD